jgi:hypothetical protein
MTPKDPGCAHPLHRVLARLYRQSNSLHFDVLPRSKLRVSAQSPLRPRHRASTKPAFAVEHHDRSCRHDGDANARRGSFYGRC